MPKAREPKPDRSVEQSTHFAKAKRRLHAKGQLVLDDQVRTLIDNPLAGEPKTGVLAGIRVVKFKVDRQQLLLAYQFDERQNVIELLDIGVHENFYRDLQQYIDDR